MRRSAKPVRKCHACLLNMGDHCWVYQYPRGQWRQGRMCRGLGNEELYHQFREWEKEPTVKTVKQLRQEVFRSKKRSVVRYRAFAVGRGK